MLPGIVDASGRERFFQNPIVWLTTSIFLVSTVLP